MLNANKVRLIQKICQSDEKELVANITGIRKSIYDTISIIDGFILSAVLSGRNNTVVMVDNIRFLFPLMDNDTVNIVEQEVIKMYHGAGFIIDEHNGSFTIRW